MVIALYPGTFDPFTNGHLDIASRASRLFDQLVIAPVYSNTKGRRLFTSEERVEMIEQAVREYGNIRVESYTGLTVDLARRLGAKVVVRGLRLVGDFEYELVLAQNNRMLYPALETVCIPTSPGVGFISSTQIKELARNGVTVDDLVPANVAARLTEAYRQ